MNILSIALREYGTRELPGGDHNPRILEYFKEIGFERVRDDETAWCAAFANFVLKKAGYKGSGALNARSFLKVGKKTDKPQPGDLVIFWRESPNSWKGHVGFFIKETPNFIYCMGGNQDNTVNIRTYPKNRLLEYRKPAKIGKE